MKRRGENHHIEPLYTMKDALDSMNLFHSVNYGKRLR